MYCECPHKEYHGTQITLKTWTRSGKIRQISETSLEQFDAIEASKPEINVKKPKRVHRKRIQSQYRQKRPKLTQYRVKKVQESGSGSDSVNRDSISSNEPSEECKFDSVCSLDTTEFQPLLCSTPTQIMSVENFQAEVSDASDSEISSATISSPSCEEEKLYQGSLLTVTNFRSNLLSIADEHAFSERAQQSVLRLVESTLPPSNNLPSFHSIRNSYQLTDFSEKRNSEGVYFHLSLEKQIVNLLSKNSDLLAAPLCQLLNEFPGLTSSENVLFLHVVLSTDGVSPYNSKHFSLYPVFLMLLNLPIKRRVQFNNLILASLFGGEKKPDCVELMSNVVNFFEKYKDVNDLYLSLNFPHKVLSLLSNNIW